MYWRFLQDWDNEHEDTLGESGVVHLRMGCGWLILSDGLDVIHWYDLPDITIKDLIK